MAVCNFHSAVHFLSLQCQSVCRKWYILYFFISKIMTLHNIIRRAVSKSRLEEQNSTRTDIIHWYWDAFFWRYDISPLRMTQTLTVIKNKTSLTHTLHSRLTVYTSDLLPLWYPSLRGPVCYDKMRCFTLLYALPLLTILYFLVWNYAAISGERQTYRLLYSGTLSIATRLQAGQSAVQLLVGVEDFSILQNTQTSSGAYPSCYSVGISTSFQRSKVTGAWTWHQTFIECSG